MKNTRASIAKISILATTLILAPLQGLARDDYLQWWGEVYPSSDSDDSVCQLCHERGGGGNGWNQYGWSIRSAYFTNLMSSGNSEVALKQSLQDISSLSDGGSSTYIAEITAGTQPGWRSGEVNLIRFNGNPNETISPPATLPCGLKLDVQSDDVTCSTVNPISSDILKDGVEVSLEMVADEFTAPVLALAAPDQPGSLYVVEQGGQVWRVHLESGAKQLFLDFSANLVSNFGQLFAGSSFEGYDERGMLGFAFHPNYASNRKVFTYISSDYVANTAHFSTRTGMEVPDHMTVISEWVVTNPLNSSSAASNERELLIVDQPQFNHNGGMLEFGPDGYLYIALGDGGSANDEGDGHGSDGNGRNNLNPLGSILRIDVDTPSPSNGRYAVPVGNPFVGQPGLDEIFVYGLRNPYRFSIENSNSTTPQLFIGDVGQDAIEEVNRIPLSAAGTNFGWNYKEGSFFFSVIDGSTFVSTTPPSGVSIPLLMDPIVEYDHEEGISVIAGYEYDGQAIPALSGTYVFADWGRSFARADGRLLFINQDDQLREFNVNPAIDIHITGFGKDLDGELYVVGNRDFRATAVGRGSLQKIVAADSEMCVPIKAKNERIALICL